MTIHFENLWEEAESLSADMAGVDSASSIEHIKLYLERLKDGSQDSVNEAFGLILLYLCAISREKNINSFAALKYAVEDMRSEMFDPD